MVVPSKPSWMASSTARVHSRNVLCGVVLVYTTVMMRQYDLVRGGPLMHCVVCSHNHGVQLLRVLLRRLIHLNIEHKWAQITMQQNN